MRNGEPRLASEVRFSRDARLPIRSRVGCQLAGAIRSGRLEPGLRLPSVRELARRLGLHRNTARAVYSELARAGLVACRQGSGVYVRGIGEPFERRGGFDEPRVDPAGAVEGSKVSAAARRIVLVEERPGLRKLLRHELAAAVSGASTVACSAREALRGSATIRRSVVTGRVEILRRLAPRLPPENAPIPLRIADPAAWYPVVDRLSPGSVVAVLSISRTVRGQARAVVEARRGPTIGLVSPDVESRAELARAMRVADLVIADVVCRRTPRHAAKTRALRVLDPSWLEGLNRVLGELSGADEMEKAPGRRNLNA